MSLPMVEQWSSTPLKSLASAPNIRAGSNENNPRNGRSKLGITGDVGFCSEIVKLCVGGFCNITIYGEGFCLHPGFLNRIIRFLFSPKSSRFRRPLWWEFPYLQEEYPNKTKSMIKTAAENKKASSATADAKRKPMRWEQTATCQMRGHAVGRMVQNAEEPTAPTTGCVERLVLMVVP
ncbi:hypothetical protein R3P38DRAFT_2781609 [Favolaschia claudopus]|uniref:Uncharacterized protein n=1 Tax=Favolaschia claudopus TaxID=2862362 RepID=A0AAW0B8I5_9AGAR